MRAYIIVFVVGVTAAYLPAAHAEDRHGRGEHPVGMRESGFTHEEYHGQHAANPHHIQVGEHRGGRGEHHRHGRFGRSPGHVRAIHGGGYRRFHRRFGGWHPRHTFYAHQYHFYPYIYSAPVVYLSSEFTPLEFNGDPYFYNEGVFYQNLNDGQGYVAVPPPVGAVVRTVPSAAEQVTIRGQIYFVYSGIFYKPVPSGYQVVEPPGTP